MDRRAKGVIIRATVTVTAAIGVPFKGTLEFTKAGKISGFFVDAVGTMVVRGWVDPNSLSFALDARYTEVGGLPPMSLFRSEENKEIETRAMEVNELRTSESSSGFEELAEQLEDEMGCGLYCRYRGVFNSISAGGVFCSNTSATSRSERVFLMVRISTERKLVCVQSTTFDVYYLLHACIKTT